MTYLNITFLEDKIDFNITESKQDENSIELEGPISQRTKKRILRLLRERFGEDYTSNIYEFLLMDWWHMKLELEERDFMELGDIRISRF